MSTAAALIIGDEILTGKVRDENGFVLAQLLFEQGVDLERILVIPDDVDLIAQEVCALSEKYDYVFTSGGIGPTHDDKTYEGVAKGMGVKLVENKEVLHRLVDHAKILDANQVLTKARKRMALLPESCEILWTSSVWVPLVVVKNIYVLPGIPSFFKLMLESAKDRFQGEPKKRVLIYTQCKESEIADALAEIQKKYPDVAIGSYPKLTETTFRVMVSLEGRDYVRVHGASEEVEKAVKGFR